MLSTNARGVEALRRRRYFIVIVCLAALLTTLSGCFRITADELYSLPQASQEYIKLQEQINTVLASGAEYAPPTAGPNRQSVQFKDIDGDSQNEAIAFFRKNEDNPLKIYIFKQSNGEYQTVDIIEGVGTAIESIRYADMDGDGISEFVVGWQNEALLHMAIYALEDSQHFLLKECDYAELVISDVNGDGNSDVIALRLPSSELPGEAEMFACRPDGDIDEYPASLSKGIDAISRIYKGMLTDDTPAIFIESGYGGSVITDILAWRYGSLVNISVSSSSGVSEDTLRAYTIYSHDINEDGIMEVPLPMQLPSLTEAKYYVIDWYAFDKFGNKKVVFTTYHDNADNWFMILPDDWNGRITVKRDDSVSGERTLIFSYITEDYAADPASAAESSSPVDFLKIYTLSGDNKEDRANLPQRIPLIVSSEIIYAAEILTTNVDLTISDEVIKAGFKQIYSEWATGVS